MSKRRRLRSHLLECLAFGGLLASAGCHAPPKPPVVVVQPHLPLPPPAAPPAPPAPPLPTPATVRTNWSFVTGSAGCVAQAAGDAGGFGIAVQSNGAVDFTVSDGSGGVLPAPIGTPVGVTFHGPAGSWSLPGTVRAGATVRAETSGGDQALGMVLAVLGGGVARAGEAKLGLPDIEIPPAAAAGAKWFACARDREHG